ncbi:ABC transporter ATP-binding protein [Erysipelothrix sp. HDW6C]|uniref:ABC transporter ATP-binding protein n=1 Tax=Erysipelothrix sp. HDW6C TaxID=2714930 RepID=UPI00140CE700|nr:ABC transporter ATP-binding protein [Erysipelothrix sp. HDW6C]QIK69607.1 ABC transporter ATP-binding protein [Erysipelothrix sp. HDW6C]
MEMIELKNISKSFGQQVALNDVNITLQSGEILGFLGPSGAGKTTTIKILTGQLNQSSGSAKILGIDTHEINESIYSQIGIVTDNSGVYEKVSVYENMRLFADILNIDKARIDELLVRVGLNDHRKKPAGKLSKGMAQRLVLARAILHQPKLLFLDEPTSGLDPSTTLEIHRLLLELKANGTAIFLTTHNMEEATKLCDNVALLYKGNIVEFGNPSDVCLKHNTDKQFNVQLTDKTKQIFTSSDQDLLDLSQLIIDGKIDKIHSSEPTLETVFLKLTGSELQ